MAKYNKVILNGVTYDKIPQSVGTLAMSFTAVMKKLDPTYQAGTDMHFDNLLGLLKAKQADPQGLTAEELASTQAKSVSFFSKIREYLALDDAAIGPDVVSFLTEDNTGSNNEDTNNENNEDTNNENKEDTNNEDQQDDDLFKKSKEFDDNNEENKKDDETKDDGKGKGKGKGRKKLTEEEKIAANEKRKNTQRETADLRQGISEIAKDMEQELASRKDFTSAVTKLVQMITAPTGKADGLPLIAAAVQSPPRVALKFIDTIPKAERTWEVGVTSTGEVGDKIPLKFSARKIEIKVVEGKPGALKGFLTVFPTFFNPEMIEALSTQKIIELIELNYDLFKENKLTYDVKPISKKLLIQALSSFELTGVIVTPVVGGNKWRIDNSAQKYTAKSDTTVTNSTGYSTWWRLICTKDNTVCPISGLNFIPISTYEKTTTPDLKKVTFVLTNRVLNVKQKETQIKKKDQLTATTKAKFKDDVFTDLVHTKGVIKGVPAFNHTKLNGRLSDVIIPVVETKTSTDGTPTMSFKLHLIGTAGYDKAMYPAGHTYQEQLLSLKVAARTSNSGTAKYNSEQSKIALTNLLKGNTVEITSPNSKKKTDSAL